MKTQPRSGGSARLVCLLLVVAILYVSRCTGAKVSDCAKNNRCSPLCFFHGECQRDGSCSCDDSWTGPNCTIPRCPQCVRGNCGKTNGTCKCSPGWTGANCDIVRGGQPWTKPTCDMFGQCICSADGQPCTDGELPDLKPNPQVMAPFIEWKLFPECDCGVDEGCTKAGKRKLLRFTMETWNVGRADLFVGYAGDYVREGDARYIWHQCHDHPHFLHWVQFVLRNMDNNQTIVGWKSGSAIIDSKRVFSGHVGTRRKYLDEFQGLQVGWADWYPYWLDCQWIDITDAEPGNYQLEVTVNPTHAIMEADFSNNMVAMPLVCKHGCVHGKCDFGSGCICDPEWQGSACDKPKSSGN